MNKKRLSEVIKEVLLNNDLVNPFKDDFSQEELIRLTTQTCTSYEDKKFKIIEIEEGEDVMYSIEIFNKYYVDVISNIEDLVTILNIDSIKIIEHLFQYENLISLNVSNKARIEFNKPDDEPLPRSIQDRSNIKIENVFGDSLDTGDVVDKNVDILNELIQVILSFDIQVKKNALKIEDENIYAIIRRMFMYANVLTNIKNAFEIFMYEFGAIKIENKKIKILYESEYYYLLKTAAKERQVTLLNESFYYFHRRLKVEGDSNYFYPNTHLNNGKISLSKGNRKIESAILHSHLSVLPVFYLHLSGIRFKGKEKVTINDIYNFLFTLQDAVRHLNAEDIISKVEQEQNWDQVPFMLNCSSLIKYLKKATSLSESTVITLINRLSQHISLFKNNLWHKPLLRVKDNYYFTLTSLAHGHELYVFDILLEGFMPLSEQEKHFAKFVKFEILKNEHKFNIHIIDLAAHSKTLPYTDTFFIIELESVILFVETAVFKLPLSSEEYNISLDRSADAAINLNEKRLIIEQNFESIIPSYNQKNKIGLVVTNHTSFSGMMANGNYIIDIKLLNSYINVGEYKRGVMTINYSETDSIDIASWKYYNDEKEFNENIKNFVHYPIPLREIIKGLNIIECPILQKGMEPQIFEHGIEYVLLSDVIWGQVKELEYFLKQFYYFEQNFDGDDSARKNIEDRIHYIIPQIFDLVAFYHKDRHVRHDILDVFKEVNVTGVIFLTFSIHNLLSNLTHKQFVVRNKSAESDGVKTNHSKAQKQLRNIWKSNSTNKPEASISSIKLTHDLNKKDYINLVKHLEFLLSGIEAKFYDEEQIDTFLFMITSYIGLMEEKEGPQFFVKSVFMNFIDMLNFNHYFQKARDFSEEALAYSFSREKFPITGWACLFKCYTKQQNILPAAFYGCLTITVANRFPQLDKSFISDILFDIMIFFRNFNNHDGVKKVYSIVSDLELSEYDEQRVTLIYFNSILQNRRKREIDLLVNESTTYLSNNKSKIQKYGQKAIVPWLVFIYNIKNFFSKGLIENIDFYEQLKVDFEKDLDSETLLKLQARFFPIEEASKTAFKESLKRVFETRYYEDLASEMHEMRIAANNLLRLSLEILDIESVLLSSLILCDNSLSYIEKNPQETAPFFGEHDVDLNEKLDNYVSYVQANFKLMNAQCAIWLFEVDNSVYSLYFSNGEYTLLKCKKWNLKLMHNWLSKISTFYFDDNGDYPINGQEENYIKTLDAVSFTEIEIEESIDEVLLFSSIELAGFPHNLIQTQLSSAALAEATHENFVKASIHEKNQTDFISFHKPITNIISLEWYIENGEELILSKDKLSLEAWAPIDDGDYALNISYTKLKPVIDKFGGYIHTGIVPSHPMASTINIFLAHGGKGFEGFRALYTKHIEGSAILKGKGVSAIFGDGVIAILFVCDSASITREIYTQRLNTFTYQVLSLGYKAVIAPSWSLSINIPSIWLTNLIGFLQEGLPLGVAVFRANKKIATEGYNEYHGFYDPTGWAAMHLFGNPNIYFK